jgi:hypothetical protein
MAYNDKTQQVFQKQGQSETVTFEPGPCLVGQNRRRRIY